MIMFTMARIQHNLGKIWKCFKNKTFGLQHYIKTNNNQNQNEHLLTSHHYKHCWTNDLQYPYMMIFKSDNYLLVTILYINSVSLFVRLSRSWNSNHF
jgi:hypothetical protein